MKHPELMYTSPDSLTVRKRLELWGASWAISVLFKALAYTCRVEFRNQEIFDDARKSYGRIIVAAWHEALGLGLWCLRGTGYHTLTSYSYDGELAARIASRFGIMALRGSSSRGGWTALNQMTRALELGETVGFTVDGPRGPRRQVKPGIAILAHRANLPIIPMALTATPAWRLQSWDRFIIPRPFGRIVCAYGEPIPAPSNSRESLENTRIKIEQSLIALHYGIKHH